MPDNRAAGFESRGQANREDRAMVLGLSLQSRPGRCEIAVGMFRQLVRLSMLGGFRRAVALDVNHMATLVAGMDQLLVALVTPGAHREPGLRLRQDWLGRVDPIAVPGTFQKTRPEMATLCESFVSAQLPPKHYEWMPRPLECEWGGSWYVGPLPIDEESIHDYCHVYGYNDFIKDFVFTPTVLAVSILTSAMVEHGDLMNVVEGLETSLKRGLVFVADHLRPSGGRAGFEAINRLGTGGVPGYIAAHPEFSPEMHRKLTEVVSTVRRRGVESSYPNAIVRQICEILREF